MVIYKALREGEVILVLEPTDEVEILEEIPVPEGEEPEEYLILLEEEVFLGVSTETKTRY